MEPKNLRKVIESSNASEWGVSHARGIQISHSQRHVGVNSVVQGPQGRKVYVNVLHEEICQRRGGVFQSKVGGQGLLASGKCGFWRNICSRGQIQHHISHSRNRGCSGVGNASNGH